MNTIIVAICFLVGVIWYTILYSHLIPLFFPPEIKIFGKERKECGLFCGRCKALISPFIDNGENDDDLPIKVCIRRKYCPDCGLKLNYKYLKTPEKMEKIKCEPSKEK